MVRCRKKEDDRKFFGRKGYATQNILVVLLVCDFDLTFVYASAGWEGSFHDNTIFKRVVYNPRDPEEDLFPPVENQADYTFQDLEDSDPTLKDREDMPQYGVLNDENDPHMNCVRNNIREQLRRQRISRERRRRQP
ncbi:hypothetical protein Vadar_032599 [Vaccinium darrowii]|uniref:Uncharacterized protein n=1 Tax=Vaccinium darrowii TaxID=229202 RepID=A0ACB7YBC7_9ERIC|nr:hypothetical protein Vadar_032599 [Vaccinium darrowii]